MHNPYYDLFLKLHEVTDEQLQRDKKLDYFARFEIHIDNFLKHAQVFEQRDKLVHQYSWAVPDEETINKIVEFAAGPIVEVGAGTGYWSYLIRQAGGDIIATDTEPRNQWSDVIYGNVSSLHRKLPSYHDSALMLCWPPYDTPMAFKALRNYNGNKVIYIGEGHGGCTGDDKFHDLLDICFDLVDTVPIPTYAHIRDNLYLLERKNA